MSEFEERLFEVETLPEDVIGRSRFDYNRVAKAAEYRLASDLMFRGHHVSIPLEDAGVDLIVDYRTLVQVKSSGRREGGRLGATLRVELNRYSTTESNPKRRALSGGRMGLLAREVDVVAVFARDTERWWHIPRSELDESGVATSRKLLLSDSPSARGRAGRFSRWLDAWDVYDR